MKSKNGSTIKKKTKSSTSTKPTKQKSAKLKGKSGDDNSAIHKKTTKKGKRKIAKVVESSDDNGDVLQYTSTVNYSNNPTPNPSGSIHDLPEPEEMLAALSRGMRPLKLEAKRLFDELEDLKNGNDQAAQDILEVKRKAQLEKLEGNELVKVDHLLRLGFDETVMKEHLEAKNKELRQEVKRKQKDVNNLGSNVQKMTTMNKESEKAVTAAHGAYGPLVVQQQTLQAKLEQAEVECYALQTKVEHRRNMKSVEIASKDRFKGTMKEIVRKLQIRCRDQELLHDVLRKAGKSLRTDLSLSPVERSALNGMNGSKKKANASPRASSGSTKRVQNDDDSSRSNERGSRSSSIETDDASESVSVSSSSSSSVSSVDVSSVES